jgi:preprotein translocase subunit YajC
LILALPLLLFWMVVSRSRRQQRVLAVRQDSLQAGMRVMTSSGVYATVVSVDEPTIAVLEIAPGVHTRWARRAIAEIFDDDEPTDDDTFVPASTDLPGSNDATPAADTVVDLTSTGARSAADEAVPRSDDERPSS